MNDNSTVMEILTLILDGSVEEVVEFVKDNNVTMNSGSEELFIDTLGLYLSHEIANGLWEKEDDVFYKIMKEKKEELRKVLEESISNNSEDKEKSNIMDINITGVVAKGVVANSTIMELLDIKIERCNTSGTNATQLDCAINGISIILDKSWDDVYDDLAKIGKNKKLVMEDIRVLDEYLYLDNNLGRKVYVPTEHEMDDKEDHPNEHISVLSFILQHLDDKNKYLIFIPGHCFVYYNSTIIEKQTIRDEDIESYMSAPIERSYVKIIE